MGDSFHTSRTLAIRPDIGPIVTTAIQKIDLFSEEKIIEIALQIHL